MQSLSDVDRGEDQSMAGGLRDSDGCFALPPFRHCRTGSSSGGRAFADISWGECKVGGRVMAQAPSLGLDRA